MTFGKYPDVSLARARERHAQQRTLLADGIDPMAQKKAVRSAARIADENSFASVMAFWLTHWQDGKSFRHVDSVRRRMAADILPALGARPINAIEAPEVVAIDQSDTGEGSA